MDDLRVMAVGFGVGLIGTNEEQIILVNYK